jgi:hypothetical protein
MTTTINQKAIQQILNQSLNEIPNGSTFTGYDFARICSKNGLEKIAGGESTLKNFRCRFLAKTKEVKRLSRKSYFKKNKFVQTEIELTPVSTEIEKAIELLKSHGYKIQKAVTNYEEI